RLIKESGGLGKSQVCEATRPYQVGGEVVFFVDGLRFDVAKRLVDRLSGIDAAVSLTHNWAALPSVTSTGKAAVTPMFEQVTGRPTDKNFQPSLKAEKKPFSSHYFKKLMAESGWQVIAAADVGDPTGMAWVECGDIDKEGHVKGIKLAERIDALLGEIIERIEELLAAGWKRIRVVTDHGWLLVPGGLPKSHLPKTATESRWGRCAELKQGIKVDELTLGWYWDQQVPVAYAPGIASFVAGKEYDHGGISLQECVTPVITIKSNRDMSIKSSGSIDSMSWRRLTCKIEVTTDADNTMADLRQNAADADSSLVRTKVVKNGKCTLMVEDDGCEGMPAIVVLLDEAGNLLSMKPTIVGGES
ncbi:MAG: PglZ domain-containing protein, partial [Mariprofundus sp.]|nr:PglZ domain-containing protein [Mariprofundus sp.]